MLILAFGATPSTTTPTPLPDWHTQQITAKCDQPNKPCFLTFLGEIFDASSSSLLAGGVYDGLCCAGEVGRLVLTACSTHPSLARARCGSDPVRLDGLPESTMAAVASWRAHFRERFGPPVAQLLLDLEDGLNEDYRALAEQRCRDGGAWTLAAGCPLTSPDRAAARLRLATFFGDDETLATVLAATPAEAAGPTPPPTLATTYREGGIEAVRRTLAGDGDNLFAPDAATAAVAASEVSLHLRNGSERDVEVLWVSSDDGSEHAVASTLAANGGDVYLTSFPGHSFVFRAADGALVASYDIPTGATGDVSFTVPANA